MICYLEIEKKEKKTTNIKSLMMKDGPIKTRHMLVMTSLVRAYETRLTGRVYYPR